MEEKIRYFLYYLADPRNGLPVYVGRTFNPRQRYKQHLKTIIDIPEKKDVWLKKLHSEGVELKMVVFAESASLEESQAAESYIASALIKKGYAFLNGLNGLSRIPYVDTTDLIGRLEDTLNCTDLAVSNNIYYTSTEFLLFAETFQKVCFRVQCILSDEHLEKLILRAKKEGRSMSDLARKYIIEGLTNDEEKK